MALTMQHVGVREAVQFGHVHRLLWIKLDGRSGGEKCMRLVELIKGCVRDKKVRHSHTRSHKDTTATCQDIA